MDKRVRPQTLVMHLHSPSTRPLTLREDSTRSAVACWYRGDVQARWQQKPRRIWAPSTRWAAWWPTTHSHLVLQLLWYTWNTVGEIDDDDCDCANRYMKNPRTIGYFSGNEVLVRKQQNKIEKKKKCIISTNLWFEQEIEQRLQLYKLYGRCAKLQLATYDRITNVHICRPVTVSM